MNVSVVLKNYIFKCDLAFGWEGKFKVALTVDIFADEKPSCCCHLLSVWKTCIH